jgi:hypothetical protein
MATIGKAVLAALAALAAVAAAGAGFGPLVVVPASPAPKRPAGQALVADPAEPPVAAQVSFPDNGVAGRTVAAVSGPSGATLTLDTPGAWQGRAALTFKGAAPPMRLTLRLAKMPNYDLESLTLTSGRLTLAVGHVTASVTTRYFDARGREQGAPEGAAYTVTARRYDGEVEVQVRRSRDGALGKELGVRCKGRLGHVRMPHHF